MSYLYNKKKKKKYVLYGFLTLILILAIFTPFYSHIYDVLEKPFLATYKNTEDLKRDSKRLFKSSFSLGKIVDENEELKNKVEQLEVEIKKYEYKDSLLKEFNNIVLYDPNIVYTPVVKKNNKGTITILGGSDVDFSIGDTIISNDGTLLGVIDGVFDHTSVINLFFKDGVSFDGVFYIDGSTSSISFTGNGNALFSEVSRNIDVNIGDILYSQKEPGYMIGFVSYIDFDPRDPMKSIYISPIHGIQDIQRVGVIVKKNNNN